LSDRHPNSRRFWRLNSIMTTFFLAALVFIHIVALHKVGSNNPDGVEIKKGPKGNRWSPTAPADGIPFHPYYTVKDIAGVAGFFIIFLAIVFFLPDFFGLFLEKPNFEPANPLKTPDHIAPVWYFTPYYAILRAVPSFAGTQFWGVAVMGLALVMFFFLPWLDRSPVKSIRYKGPLFKIALGVFAVSFVILAYLGMQPASPVKTLIAQICTALYFLFFLLMPWYSKIDKTKPAPERVTQ